MTPVGRCAFLDHYGARSEAGYKRKLAPTGRIMQHAQIACRDFDLARRAWAEIYISCARGGVTVDCYGISLDWSMGYPAAERSKRPGGAGLVLSDREQFAQLTSLAPVAPHFGDFILGFPAAIENTQSALLAGATTIGNLGQYFTVGLPDWDDDVATTAATVEALGLIAAQDTEILVHSSLDDGFAMQFADMAGTLGAALFEKRIVEELIGAKLSHSHGQHFSDPVKRLAFQLALAQISDTPGTVICGNTASYRGSAVENYVSLANYLMVDAFGQMARPTGHAVTPVPTSVNAHTPDMSEIVEAQMFAGRLIEHAGSFAHLMSLDKARPLADRLVADGRAFATALWSGLKASGIDTDDAVEVLLAARRLGGRKLEEMSRQINPQSDGFVGSRKN